MYWDCVTDELRRTIFEARPKAKKEHVCCEGEKIAIGKRYHRIDGIWENQDNYWCYRKTLKICLTCEEDWNTLLQIFRDNGEDDALIVYGKLKEAVLDAYEHEYIWEDHPLIRKWHPEVYRNYLRQGIPKEEVIWKEVEEVAVRTGLQPALPGL